MAGIASFMGSMMQVDKRVTHLYGLLLDLNFFSLLNQTVTVLSGVGGGPLFGLFSLGMLCPFANSKVSSTSSHFMME